MIKIQLQPCEKAADKFIKEMYDTYLYQINSDSDFWVKITGRYITPLSSEEIPVFAVNFLVLINKNEVGLVESNKVTNELIEPTLK